MRRIWAPWRIEYILSRKGPDCIFCTEPGENEDEKNYILYRGKLCYVIMNIYPYNSGHLMVVPYQHVEDLSRLPEETMAELMVQTKLCCAVLKEAINPQGFNIGLNIGEAAGAGIKEHLHQHIVPRWDGDTNFMAVLDDVRVMPQHLRETYDLLNKVFSRYK